MAVLDSTPAVIAALGGTSAVAKLTGRKMPAVSNWKKSGIFPANTYQVIKAALNAMEHTAPDTLWSFYASGDGGYNSVNTAA